MDNYLPIVVLSNYYYNLQAGYKNATVEIS